MNIIVLIPAFLIFLYFIYKLVKDDYVFIRKNISLEQIFDITFIVTWVSLFFARVFYFIFHPLQGHNLFLVFFSPQVPGFSLVGLVLGGILAMYIIGRYRKIPLGRLFDFFTLAFVVALPVGFLGTSVLMKNFTLAASLVNTIVYMIFAIFCVKYVNPKLESRELKEGNLQILFLLFFSVVSFINVTMLSQVGKVVLLSVESVILIILFLISFILFVRQAKLGFMNKKR